MNLAQKCIQSARKSKELLHQERNAVQRPNVRHRNKNHPGDVPTKPTKNVSPATIHVEVVDGLVSFIGSLIFNGLLAIISVGSIGYVALVFIAGGTDPANIRIQSLIASSTTPDIHPTNAQEDVSSLRRLIEQQKIKNNAKSDTDNSAVAQPRESEPVQPHYSKSTYTPSFPGGPLPNGPILSARRNSNEIVEPTTTTASAINIRQQDQGHLDDQSSSKVKLLSVDKKVQTQSATQPTELILAKPQDASSFEVVTITEKAVVIKTDSGMRQIQVGQLLPDGRHVDSVDAKGSLFVTNGKAIQVQ
jgi:hypothetical protein